MSNAVSRLQTFFVQQGGEPVAPEAPLQRHLDSVAMLDFIVFIEQEFGVTVADMDVTPKNFSCLEAVATYIFARTTQ